MECSVQKIKDIQSGKLKPEKKELPEVLLVMKNRAEFLAAALTRCYRSLEDHDERKPLDEKHMNTYDAFTRSTLARVYEQLEKWGQIKSLLDQRSNNLAAGKYQYVKATDPRVRAVGVDAKKGVAGASERLNEIVSVETEWVKERSADDVPSHFEYFYAIEENTAVREMWRLRRDVQALRTTLDAFKAYDKSFRAEEAYLAELTSVGKLKAYVKVGIEPSSLLTLVETGKAAARSRARSLEDRVLQFMVAEARLRGRVSAIRRSRDEAIDAIEGTAARSKELRLKSLNSRISQTTQERIFNVVAGKGGYMQQSPQMDVAAKRLLREIEFMSWTALLPPGFFKPEAVRCQQELLELRRNEILRKHLEDEELEKRKLAELQRQKEAAAREELIRQKEKEIALATQGKIVAEILDPSRKKKRKVPIKRRIKKWMFAKSIKQKAERQRMEKSVLERQVATVGFIQGFSDIKFSVGGDEMAAFEEELAKHRRHGIPGHELIGRNFGKRAATHFWAVRETDPARVITAVELAHTIEAHPAYKSFADDPTWQQVTHKKLSGKGGDPGMCLWVQRGGTNPIVDITVSFTRHDEKRLKLDNYKKLKEDLSEFGMSPDTFVWIKYGEVGKRAKRHLDKEKLELQRQGFAELLAQNPGNPRLRGLLQQTLDDLKELEARGPPPNRVNAMVEFLGLSAPEVKKLMKAYKDMDVDLSGEVDLEEFFDYIDEERNSFSVRIFRFLDSSSDGSLDFNEFMHALGTFCMFGRGEIVKMVFGFYDAEGKGYITEEHLRNMFREMHEQEPLEVPALRKCINTFGKDPSGKIPYPQFAEMARRYPAALFPAFRVQDAMMRAFMGKQWWVRKRDNFAQVRAKLKKKQDRAQAKLEKKKRRLEREEARQRRRAEREKKRIEDGKNGVKPSTSRRFGGDSNRNSRGSSSTFDRWFKSASVSAERFSDRFSSRLSSTNIGRGVMGLFGRKR